MNNLDLSTAVFIQNQQIKTDSLKVAEYFGKRHTHVLEKIENLDCSPTFSSANFSAHVQEIQIGKGATRESKYYEMTKDGWMFLVMGFTGEKAAKIKEAFITAFNLMAATLHNQQIESNRLQVGSVVQLKSGSPALFINQLIYNPQGYLEYAEVAWFKNRLHKEIVPIASLTLDPITQYHNQVLEQFWSAVHEYGLEKLNHSKRPQTIALNLSHIYKTIPDLPPQHSMYDALKASDHPYPKYIGHNMQVRSQLIQTNTKCWQFQNVEIKNYLAEKEIEL